MMLLTVAVLVLKAVTTLLAGLFVGAASYIYFVQCKVRSNLKNPVDVIEDFQKVMPTAKPYNSKLCWYAAMGGLASFAASPFVPGSLFFLAGGLLMYAVFPWTKTYLVPHNIQIMKGDAKDQGEEWINNTAKTWAANHFVRLNIAAASLVSYTVSWIIMAL